MVDYGGPQTHLKASHKLLEDHRVPTVMDVPPQSPNLNPTEHLWGHFRAEEVKHPMTSQEALGSPVKSCWDNTSHQVCTNLASPCQLEYILALNAQGIPNTKIF